MTADGSARDRTSPLRVAEPEAAGARSPLEAPKPASAPPSSGTARRLPRGSLVQRLRAMLLAIGSWLVRRLPEGAVLRIANLAGALWYRASPDRAARARRNLRRVVTWMDGRGVGEDRVRAAARDERALERLVRSAYRHAARYYLEMIRTPSLTPQELRERLLVETPDVVEQAFADDRPLIFVALHFGAIELPALYLAQRTGGTATVPMETLGDPELQRWFVRSRGRAGLRIVGLREARRELLAALRRGEAVGLVGDRDLTGGGIEVPLFGMPARLPLGPALLAIESGSPLYLAAVRRAGPGRYRGELRPIRAVPEGSRRQRATAIVQALATEFELAIAKAPDQWWTVFFPVWDDLDPPAAGESAA